MNIPDYTLLQSCGKGAYGQVWLAQSQTNKLIALKYVANSQAGDREFEGLINYSKLPESPHLIRILHLGKLEDGFFYTMELADGLYSQGSYVPETLAERLRRTKRLPVTEVMELAAAILSALGTLHGEGMVHRDLKPENILYVNGVPKLSDVGLVRSSEQTVSLGGTLGFIPPERLKPGNSGAYNMSDDLYALGKVLYCALTGKAVEKFPSVPPEMISNTLCCHLNQIILKACGREEDRFRNTRDFLSSLQNGTEQKAEKRSPYKKILFAGAIVLLIIITSAITAKISFSRKPADEEEINAKFSEIQNALQVLKDTQNQANRTSQEYIRRREEHRKQEAMLKALHARLTDTPAPSKSQEPQPKQPAAQTQKSTEKTLSEAQINQYKLELRQWKEKERVQIEKQQYSDEEKELMVPILKADELKEKHGAETIMEYIGPAGNTIPVPDPGKVPRRMTKLYPLENKTEDSVYVDYNNNPSAGNLPQNYMMKGSFYFNTPRKEKYLDLHTLSFYFHENTKGCDIDVHMWLSVTKGTLLTFSAKDQAGTHTTHFYNYFTNANENYLHLLQDQNQKSCVMRVPFEVIKMGDNIILYVNDQLVLNVKNEGITDFSSFILTANNIWDVKVKDWEIYDITPDPECPPEEMFVLPGQRKPAKKTAEKTAQ